MPSVHGLRRKELLLPTPPAGDQNMNLVKKLVDIVRQYHAFRKTCSELSQLSDDELKDIGVYRNDIVGLAYKAAEEKVSGRKVLPIGALGLTH
jgi:uncharacterized protein YjiS (DUF1127 family)